MKLKNVQMSNYIDRLQAVADKATGRLGYAVAWNLRNLATVNQEFAQIKNDLIDKYGKPQEDGKGNQVIGIDRGTEEYSKFLDEISEYAEIEHEVDVFKVQPEDVYPSSLTASEILGIDFMIDGTKSDGGQDEKGLQG